MKRPCLIRKMLCWLDAQGKLGIVEGPMKRPNVIVRTAIRIWCWLFLKHGLYYGHSTRYRLMPSRRKYAGHTGQVARVEDLNRLLAKKTWKRDGIAELGDAIGWPRQIAETGNGDCDEFGVLALDAGRGSVIDGNGNRWIPHGLLTVVYMRSPTRAGGHNVGLFRKDVLITTPEYAHAGNWGWFSGFLSITATARDIACDRGTDLPLMAWSLAVDDPETGRFRTVAYRWIGGK